MVHRAQGLYKPEDERVFYFLSLIMKPLACLRRTAMGLFLVAVSLSLVVLPTSQTSQTVIQNRNPERTHRTGKSQQSALEEYGKLPIGFEPNWGQADSTVKFLTRGNGYALFLTANEAVVALANPQVTSGRKKRIDAVRLGFRGANRNPSVSALDELGAKNSYLRGKDPRKWQANVPTYGRVRYENVYDGIDLVYYGLAGLVEYDFVIAPRANPELIKIVSKGGRSLRLDQAGNLRIENPSGDLVLRAPVAYQDLDGVRQTVASKFVVRGREISFWLGDYDQDRELVIDPVLSYSTYLGGTGHSAADDEAVSGITVDSAGNAYVVGSTVSMNFPIVNAYKPTNNGNLDVFISKFNPSGTALVYSTYLGGDFRDEGRGIAVDANGSAYVTGISSSSNFPTTPGAFQTSGLDTDVFVTKLNPSGNGLVYSTVLSGDRTVLPNGGGTLSSAESGYAIAVNSLGEAYVTGETQSSNFPIANATQSSGAGVGDAFVTKLNAAGSGLIFSTYLGGANSDRANGIALDSGGNAYLTGDTYSLNFPTTGGAYRTTRTSGTTSIGFVSKFTAAGSLVYATYLGDTFDRAQAIAVNNAGEAVIAGETSSLNFPTTADALRRKAIQGALLKSPDRSLHWTSGGLSSEFQVNAVALDPTNSGTQYAGTQAGIFKTANGGNSWTFLGLSTSSILSIAVDPNNPNTVFAGTGGQGIFKSIDGGNNWSNPVASGSVFTLVPHPQTPAKFYAGISGGGLQSSDGGNTWLPFGSGGTIRAIAFVPGDPNTIYLAAFSGVIKSNDGGANWTNVLPNTSTFGSIVIDPANPSVVYAGHRSFGVYKTTNAGQTWNALFFSGQILSMAIDGSTTPTTVYACRSGEGVSKTTDGGLNWSVTGLGYSSVNSLVVDRLAPANLYAGVSVGGNTDAFVTRLNSSGSALIYSTLLGGTGFDSAYAVALNSAGHPVVAGAATSVDLTFTNPMRPKTGSVMDGFVALLNTSSSTISFASFIGGSGIDRASAVAVDLAGNIYIGGHTRSADFPTVAALQPTLANVYDAFVAKITLSPPPQLILEQSGPLGNQAAAVDSLLLLRDPFPLLSLAPWFHQGTDRNTRVFVFATDLMLNPGETAAAVTVNLVDSNSLSRDIAAEDVRAVPNSSFVQVTFKLPSDLPAGVCQVTIKAHGQTSNTGAFRIAP